MTRKKMYLSRSALCELCGKINYHRTHRERYLNCYATKIFIIAMILLSHLSLLPAMPSNQDLNEARAYYESEDYVRSQSMYEGFLDDEMPAWQQQVLHYDIATSLLSAGKSDEASIQLDMLSNQGIGLPQLKQRVFSNLALARLMQLNEHIANLEKSSEDSYLDYNRVFTLFYKVFQDINKADAAWCELEVAEGAVSCAPSIYLQEMRVGAENALKEFLAKNQKESFDFSRGSVKEALEQLSMLYGLALIKDPLQKSHLDKILENQTTFGDTFLKNAGSSQKSDFEKAQKYLKLSIQSLNQEEAATSTLKGSNAIRTRIFAEAARFFILNILEEIDIASTTQPKNVLENTIAKVELILLLENLRKQGDEKSLAGIDLLLPELQQSALNNADLFFKVVLTHQKEAFSSSTIENACQCHPWDEVIPLFSDGYARADLANKKLKQGNFDLDSILHLQNIALDKWKEALVRLSATTKQEEEKPGKQPNQAEQQPPGKDQESAKFNDIQRLVQEMESDDRSRPQQIKAPAASSGVNKPW